MTRLSPTFLAYQNTAGLNPNPKRKVKWEVQKVTIHEAAKEWESAGKLGTVIDKISGAGVDTINNVSFSVSNKSLYRNQLLAQAVENARQQAAVVANAGGRTLGKLLSASISSYNNFERSLAAYDDADCFLWGVELKDFAALKELCSAHAAGSAELLEALRNYKLPK